jgi:hypothetical protein
MSITGVDPHHKEQCDEDRQSSTSNHVDNSQNTERWDLGIKRSHSEIPKKAGWWMLSARVGGRTQETFWGNGLFLSWKYTKLINLYT